MLKTEAMWVRGEDKVASGDDSHHLSDVRGLGDRHYGSPSQASLTVLIRSSAEEEHLYVRKALAHPSDRRDVRDSPRRRLELP